MSNPILKVAYFNMPHTTRENDIEVHRRIRCELVDTFGAYTDYPVRGAWKDNTGKVIRDPNQVRYEVAYDCRGMMARESNFEKLRMIALIAGVSLRQQAVYLIDHAGVAHIEEITY